MCRRFAIAAVLEVCEIAAWGECAACVSKRESRWLQDRERWKKPAPIQVRALLAFMSHMTREKCENAATFESKNAPALATALYKFLSFVMPTLREDLDDRIDDALKALYPLSENSGIWTEDIKVLRDRIASHPLIGLDPLVDFLDV